MKIRKPKPILIVGHKRSGSTHLARLLNLHDKIFISNETDILWISYLLHHGKQLLPYSFDGPVGFNECLKKFKHLLSEENRPYDNFLNVLFAAKNDGFLGFQKQDSKKDLEFIGDQKPFQQADPLLVNFANDHFPKFKMIHIIRHPFSVIRSCKEYGPHKDGGHMWKALGPEQIFQRWVKVEKFISEHDHNHPNDIIHIKYEDIVKYTEVEIEKLCRFLKLPCDIKLLHKSRSITKKENKKLQLKSSIPDEAKEIMVRYGYI